MLGVFLYLQFLRITTSKCYIKAMNKKAIIVALIFAIVVILGGYKFFSSRSSSVAGLKVISLPSASIFLNDKLIGKTPYEDRYPAGEYVLKLIPEETATQASSWQGKVVLNPSVLTYLRRDLGPSELTSAGEIVTMEKVSGNEAQIAVFSSPDGAIAIVDGQEKGMTPLLLRNVTEGEHDVAVASPGFLGRTVRVQTNLSYKLVVNFQLALSDNTEATVSASPIPKEVTVEKSNTSYVLIKDTPTGFLRVRSSPSTSASETAQIKPGEKYPFLEAKSDWYKISYDTGKEGWVSARYAEKID